MIDTGEPIAIPVVERPGRGCRARSIARPPCGAPAPGTPSVGPDRGPWRSHPAIATLFEVGPFGVEYLVRAARITDIERIVSLSGGVLASRGRSPMDAADLLRQLVYLPQASVVVAEARREVVGGGILALRPSVRSGGFVGTVDLLVVDPEHDADRITDALLEELVRSARNKGCAVVEAARPEDPAELARWVRQGFAEGGPLIVRTVAVGATARRA
jgi:L-amino acid N-acyltransferase YncA